MSAARLVALGWATVDADHPAAGWRAASTPPAGAGRSADEVLGARAAAVESPAGLVLLEPSTEGRVAASLARHGEGPAAIYLRTARTTEELRAAGVVLSGTGHGPFGREAVVLAGGVVGGAVTLGPGRFGPHVVVVLEPPLDTIGS